MAGWLSYRHRKSNHLWQRWLHPLHNGSTRDYAPHSLEPNRLHPLSLPAAIVGLLTSFCSAASTVALIEVCSRAAAAAAAAAAKDAAPSFHPGRSFPPPGSGSSSFASSGGAECAHTEPHRERRTESQRAKISFKTFVSLEFIGPGNWLIGALRFGHKPHSFLPLLWRKAGLKRQLGRNQTLEGRLQAVLFPVWSAPLSISRLPFVGLGRELSSAEPQAARRRRRRKRWLGMQQHGVLSPTRVP